MSVYLLTNYTRAMKTKQLPTPHRSQPAAPDALAAKSDAGVFGDAVKSAAAGQPLRGHGLVRRVRAHVPTATIRPLAARLALTLKEVATLLGLTERTLARRLEEPESYLDTTESERLLLLDNLALHGLAVFEDIDKFNRWLRRPLPVLEGLSPLAYLDTATSFQVVDQLLGRLEHGVYS